jgi:hypothetical protein
MSPEQVEFLILGSAQCGRGTGQLGGCFPNGALTGRCTPGWLKAVALADTWSRSK